MKSYNKSAPRLLKHHCKIIWSTSNVFGKYPAEFSVALNLSLFCFAIIARNWSHSVNALCAGYCYKGVLTHWGRDNMAAVSQTTLSNAFSWMKMLLLISIKISLKFVPKGPINDNPSLVQIMAWCRSGDKPLSEPMMVSLLTHIWVTRPQWVKYVFAFSIICRQFRWHGQWKSFLKEDNDYFKPHCQCYCCRCPGDARSQISAIMSLT